jgi:hypothetical protein
MKDLEQYFVEEVKASNMTDPLEILNWYRNLYYTENDNTERGVMARAINDLFTKYKIELNG